MTWSLFTLLPQRRETRNSIDIAIKRKTKINCTLENFFENQQYAESAKGYKKVIYATTNWVSKCHSRILFLLSQKLEHENRCIKYVWRNSELRFFLYFGKLFMSSVLKINHSWRVYEHIFFTSHTDLKK